MAFQVSPGVITSEVDLTTVVPAVGTTTGAYAGQFNWGPLDFPISVANETKLVEFFGKPDSNTATSFFTAANFLAYGNDLRVVRAGGNANSMYTAVANASTTNITIGNADVYSQSYYEVSTPSAGAFAARYPGSLGNSLKVSVCGSSNTVQFNAWAYSNLFQGAPGTSVTAAAVGGSNDELHVVVIDEDGLISGTANTVLEVYPFLSKASDAKDSVGNSNYYRDVLFTKSRYVYWTDHVDSATTSATWGKVMAGRSFAQLSAISDISLVNGADGSITNGDLIRAYGKFGNPEEIDISFILTGSHAPAVVSSAISIAESRKDTLVFVSPTLANVQSATAATDIVNYRYNALANVNTSYAVMDSGWKYQYDKYNDVYRWVPLNGDIAGLCVRTDQVRDPWFSPAGMSRGNIKNVVKLAYYPDKADRDTLYKAGVNPVVSFPGEGTILYGDKTLLSKPSAFDRINVRRLFIVLEKAIARAARAQLFEFNDEFTRAQFVSIVEPFLRGIKGRRGIFDYRVVCDTTNNTPEVIDRNEFIGDIYVKPARSINFIQLNFIAVRTGVAFDEVVGRF